MSSRREGLGGWAAGADRCLAEAPTEERQDVFGLGVTPQHLLGEDQFAVEVDVEDAACSRDDLDSADCVFPLLEDARDQTGRVRPCASGNAVLDPNMMAPGHGRHRSPHQGRFTGPLSLLRGRVGRRLRIAGARVSS